MGSWKQFVGSIHIIVSIIHWVAAILSVSLITSVWSDSAQFKFRFEVYGMESTHVTYNLMWLMFIQFTLYAIYHSMTVVNWYYPGCCCGWMDSIEDPGPNIAMWTVMGLCNGLLVWVVATVCGMTSFFALLSLAGIASLLFIINWILEYIRWHGWQERANMPYRIMTWISWEVRIFVWGVILVQLGISIHASPTESPPILAHFIAWGVFICIVILGLMTKYFYLGRIHGDKSTAHKDKSSDQGIRSRCVYYRAVTIYSLWTAGVTIMVFVFLLAGGMDNRDL